MSIISSYGSVIWSQVLEALLTSLDEVLKWGLPRCHLDDSLLQLYVWNPLVYLAFGADLLQKQNVWVMYWHARKGLKYCKMAKW